MMRNYKVSIDISDLYDQIKLLKIRDFSQPFMTIFINAKNPDDACYIVINSLLVAIINKNSSLSSRILCRMIRRISRINKVEAL